MLSSPESDTGSLDAKALEALQALRGFEGPEHAFWLSFAEQSTRWLSADWGVLVRRRDETWQAFCFWPVGGRPRHGVFDPGQLSDLAETTRKTPLAYLLLQSRTDRNAAVKVLGTRLETEGSDEPVMALFGRSAWQEEDRAQDLLKREIVVGVHAAFFSARTLRQTREELDRVSEPLDLMLCLNDHRHYLGAAMAFCNELSSRHGCSRVSLGWERGGYVRIQAVSHMERFDRKMDAVQALEAAMEECLDQDEEIVLPPLEDGAVTRAHVQFADRYGQPSMLSLPLRLEQKGVGVLTCEREAPFEGSDIRALRIACDQATRRLDDLKRSDRWFGARLADAARGWIGGLVGFEHTWAKVAGVLASLVLAVLLFGSMTYRVEAPFILRTEDLAFLSAPFDGYIEKVNHKAGDVVEKDRRLLALDTRELRLQESRAVADLQRYFREEEKARAENALADMRVAAALKRQAETRLEIIRNHLEHAEIRAPFSGVVVEGDLEKLLGAPVRKGDVLLKVARLKNLYVEMKVSERDIQEIREEQSGVIAFISRPGSKYDVTVQRIEPMAVTEEKGNVFRIRGRLEERGEDWWRPGMSGLAKIHAGERKIWWVLLHRTLDVIRLAFWW